METLKETWNLDVIFPGGSESSQFAAFLTALRSDISAFQAEVARITAQSPKDAYVAAFLTMQDLFARLRQAGAFVSCLNAQNVKDDHAKLLSGRMSQLSAGLTSALNQLDAHLLQISESDWSSLLADPRLSDVSFALIERRNRTKNKLDPARETLISDLMVDGYHAWSQLYSTIVGRMTLPFEEDGALKQLSMGQAANQLNRGDRSVRERAFAKWEQVWAQEADLIGSALNHLGGFRIEAYKHRGWDSILQEPLEINRMTAETLDVMWNVIEQNKGPVVEYLNRKAKMMGLSKLSWHDVSAPLSASKKSVSYDEAAQFIIQNFGKFNPEMAAFAESCFENQWIEVENRPNKAPGGFCTNFPVSEQTRVFMTFSGMPSNVATLAHELGHAYHQHVMRGLPFLVQGYAMNVAETASTFAEMIVADAAVKSAETHDERVSLLEDKIGRGVTMFMNIHSRFLFETRFYAERSKGRVSTQALCDLMEQAQKDAFHNALSEYHPHFWASKGHFYSTGVPFYNFPYTFGYLFSNGIYARALSEGPSFSGKYVDLLRDTGRSRVEDLAARHLGVDITKAEFWQGAVDLTLKDVREFLALTE